MRERRTLVMKTDRVESKVESKVGFHYYCQWTLASVGCSRDQRIDPFDRRWTEKKETGHLKYSSGVGKWSLDSKGGQCMISRSVPVTSDCYVYD
jgi:hypothetical protein